MPEPPPPYTAATAPALPFLAPQAGTSSSNAHQNQQFNNNSNQGIAAAAAVGEQKFAPSTPFTQQPPLPPPASNPFMVPPGAIPSCIPESAIPPPPLPMAQGFYPAPPTLLGQGAVIAPAQTATMIHVPAQRAQNGSGGQIKVIYAVPLGPQEAQLECTNCHQPIRTKVVRRAGLLPWLVCGALALVGCWPCCLLPFCLQSCQDVEHFCPNCGTFLGKYSRI